MAARKVQVTKNYDLFERSPDNRDADLSGRKKLIASMEEHGFIPSFHIVVRRGKGGKMVIVDGQHRLAAAQHLGLPVYFMEEDVQFNTAQINSTMVTWKLEDYVQMWAGKGVSDFIEAQQFAASHGISVGKACSILAGTVSTSNVQAAIKTGTFHIKDRSWAETVAAVYVAITRMSKDISKMRFLEAVMAVTRVKGFDVARMVSGAKRCQEKLTGYSTRDGNLEMLEEIYNFGRKQMFGLKVAALMALRDRNIVGNATGEHEVG